MRAANQEAVIFLAGHLLVSAVVLASFCWFFQKSYSILAVHLLIIASVFIVSAAFFRMAEKVLARLGFSSALKLLFRVLFAFYFVYLILFAYAGNVISNLSFGGMVDKNIVSFVVSFPYSFFQSLYAGGENANIDYRVGIVLAIWAFTFLVLFIPAFVFSKRVFASVITCRSSASGKALASCSLLFLLAMYFIVDPRSYSWIEDEPIVSSLIDDWGPFYEARRIERADHLEKVFLKSEPQQGNQKNLIIINLDALRVDMVSAYNAEKQYLTPFIDRLWKNNEIVKIDDVFSVCATSWCGIAGILASNYAPELAVNSVSLQRALGKNGYENHFFLSGVHFWFGLNRFYRYGDSLTTFVEGAASQNYQVGDDAMILEKLSVLKPFSGKPAFFYIHLMSPHIFGIKKQEFVGFSPIRYSNALSEGYEDGVRQSDYYVEQIFKLLQEKGYLDNSVVFITSDHGESLGERGLWGHGVSVFNQDINVPWLIWSSDAIAIKHKRWASQVDMAPTAFALLGMDPPDAWVGKSITDAIAPRVLQAHSAGPNGLGTYACLIDVKSHTEVFKYIRYYQPFRPHYDEYFFDLVNDPSEQADLSGSADSQVLHDYRKAWEDMFIGRL